MLLYDFKSISPSEFENLSRDLMKAERGMDFEIFKQGRDGGVDLRHAKCGNEIIVQCKHYANSRFSTLLSNLKNKELPKVKKLNPSSYIVITSLELSPKEKKEIQTIMSPYVLEESDIIGNEQLNAWLREYPQVEKNYFNLWACTVPIMERILHSGIYNYTESQMDELETKLRYSVKSPNFNIAQEILQSQRFCIIAGAPGIGKTTLAEMLLIDYMRSGYTPIAISNDIEEGFNLYNPNEKQVFYYDDFLGQTGLDNKLNKNEDERIISFSKMCNKSANSLFIMTTREYILNQAKSTYEKLSRSGIDLNKCIIDTNSYTQLDRAKIFYNHLYFKSVPNDYIVQLLGDQNYLKIVNNPSFNPRVIEFVTEESFIHRTKPENYVSEILKTLNTPHIIWEHVYKNQISKESQQLLVVLLSCSERIKLTDFRSLYRKFRINYVSEFGGDRSSDEFKSSLKECEGDFLKITLINNDQIVSFRNPSVRDYIALYLSEDVELLSSLVDSISSFTQIMFISNSYSSFVKNPFNENMELFDLFQTKIADNINTNNLSVSIYSTGNGKLSFYQPSHTILDHCSFILRMDIDSPSKYLNNKLSEYLTDEFSLSSLALVHDWDPIISTLELIDLYRDQFTMPLDDYVGNVITVLPENLNQISDYKALAELCLFSSEAARRLAKNFDKFIDQLYAGFDDEIVYTTSVDDLPLLEECDAALRVIKKCFGDSDNMTIMEEELAAKIYELHELPGEEEPPRNPKESEKDNSIESVNSLFNTFLEL